MKPAATTIIHGITPESKAVKDCYGGIWSWDPGRSLFLSEDRRSYVTEEYLKMTRGPLRQIIDYKPDRSLPDTFILPDERDSVFKKSIEQEDWLVAMWLAQTPEDHARVYREIAEKAHPDWHDHFLVKSLASELQTLHHTIQKLETWGELQRDYQNTPA